MIRIVNIGKKKSQYCDVEVVEGLQRHDAQVEEWFYASARRYFHEHFNAVFFDQDKKQEIFQIAFLKIWTEIDNGKIMCRENQVLRQQRSGSYAPMTCNLLTFTMAFAKNEYRELVRSNKLDNVEEIFENQSQAEPMSMEDEENPEDAKRRIVDECLQKVSSRCVEILTLFYYEEKSLDEILQLRQDKNSSKNGLKTAKNKCMNTLRSLVADEFRKYNY